MKTITCNLCGASIGKARFKIKVTSPFIDAKDFTSHCCCDCYDKLWNFLNAKEVSNEDG